MTGRPHLYNNWATSGRQLEDIWETAGRQVEDKWKATFWRQLRVVEDNLENHWETIGRPRLLGENIWETTCRRQVKTSQVPGTLPTCGEGGKSAGYRSLLLEIGKEIGTRWKRQSGRHSGGQVGVQ